MYSRRGYSYSGYVPPRYHRKMAPMWCYYIGLALAVTVLIVGIGFLAYDIQTDRNIYSGTVIEKMGQNKPIIAWPVTEYGYRAGNEIQDPEGWFVLVQDGNRFQRFRLTKDQFDKVQLNASIWRFGPWTFWKNRS